ncbi:universal stress protein [Motiliproteus sp. MSK22-1]|uniref:universal stress protein n=1 Tax=Motiliproteus sp. MSK22-1 TaxID=1897630 RepID=UPI0009786EA6|nr:universal stress protein [Motiliproteus sp. MSK22-1]OMH32108.1 hypothetical protein BGP75_15530 [Motiliproteus sp. MSK22-1]
MNNKYKNILIPVDLAHESSWRSALPMAVEQARNNDARLHVVTVVPNADIPAIAAHLPSGIDRHIKEEGKGNLKALVERLVPDNIITSVTVGQGRIYKEVLRIAREADADLIVMASHRPELTDYLIGANASHVMRHAQCSVLVVREKVQEKTRERTARNQQGVAS